MKYPEDMDAQCIPLCDAINSIPGLETSGSCCGHGKDSFMVWFHFSDRRKVKYLTIMGRVFDRSYGGRDGWTCTLGNTDQPKNCPIFFINSGDVKGRKAYADAKKIADNIYEHLQHKAFREIFLPECSK